MSNFQHSEDSSLDHTITILTNRGATSVPSVLTYSALKLASLLDPSKGLSPYKAFTATVWRRDRSLALDNVGIYVYRKTLIGGSNQGRSCWCPLRMIVVPLSPEFLILVIGCLRRYRAGRGQLESKCIVPAWICLLDPFRHRSIPSAINDIP